MEESKFEILAKSRKLKTTKIFWGLINNYRPKIKELSKIHSRIARFTQELLDSLKNCLLEYRFMQYSFQARNESR